MKKLLLLILTVSSSLLFAQISWEPTNGPAGGNIEKVFAGPDGYAYTTPFVTGWFPSQTLYRSADYAATWDIIVEEGIDYVAGVDDIGAVYIVDSVTLLRSDDHGVSWDPVFQNAYYGISILDAPGDLVYGIGARLIRSEDNGESWTFVDSSLDNYYVVVNSSGNLIKLVDNELRISTDMGSNWTLYASLDTISSLIQAIDINQQDEIFIGTYGPGVYRLSADGSELEYIAENFFDIADIEISSNGTIYARTYLGVIYVSTDNGNSWQGSMQGMVSSVGEAIVTDPSGNAYVGWADGIFKTENNGASWILSNEGINRSSLSKLMSGPDGEIYGLTNKIVWKSENNGQTWEQVFLANAYLDIYGLHVMADGTIFLFTEDLNYDKGMMEPCNEYSCSHLMRSIDGGETWEQLLDADIFNDLTMNSEGELYLSVSHEIMKSSDNGQNWQLQHSMLYLKNIVSDSSDILYGHVPAEGFYSSEDEGITWNPLSPTEYPDIADYLDLEITGSGVMYSLSNFLSGGDYFWRVYKSETGGEQWVDVTPFDSLWIKDIVIGLFNHVYLTYAGGVLKSTDNGETWENISGELTNAYSLTEDLTGVLYLSTYGSGVWRSESFVSAKTVKPEEYLLELFPNPASNQLFIDLADYNHTKSQSGNQVILLKVFNSYGKQVKTARLLSSPAALDISEFPSGFYTIEVNGKVGKFIKK